MTWTLQRTPPPRVAGASSQERFEERAAAERHRRRRRIGTAAALLIGAATLVWLIWFSPVLAATSVRVDGVSGGEQRAVRDLVLIPPETPLARVDTDALAARVRTRVTVADVKVSRSWPHTVVVHVTPRTPFLVLKTARGELQVVDREGVAYGTVVAAPKGIPVVTALGAAGATPAALKTALAVLPVLPSALDGRVRSIQVTSANLVTIRTADLTIVWGGSGDGPLKARIVTALMATKAKVIDVSAPGTPVTR